MRDKDGTFLGTICGDLGPKCGCGCVADVLCDFPVGRRGKTCSRLLCALCAVEEGEDLHYCADHHREYRSFRLSGGFASALARQHSGGGA